MSGSYINNTVHFIFRTKSHRKQIYPDLEKRLYAYLGGIARQNNMKALAINGTEDHVHLVVSLPATISLAKAVQLIKGGSSKWVHENFNKYRDFKWQPGYGAFSVGYTQLKTVVAYVNNQKINHQKVSFHREFRKLLTKYDINYDEKYMWD